MQMDRRTLLLAVGTSLATQAVIGQTISAQPTPAQTKALREMQIYKVPELGLNIWVENQPPWEAELSNATGHPSFVVQSPNNYHPPAVLTYASWPNERATDINPVAQTAISRASQNFGLNANQARSVTKLPTSHGVLRGLEGSFAGQVEGVAMDVRVFVGQAPGRFPVALSVYTLAGKMGHLQDVVRRGWGKLAYLS
jgi:hypothetical protein